VLWLGVVSGKTGNGFAVLKPALPVVSTC
jgi:hypothetical protein